MNVETLRARRKTIKTKGASIGAVARVMTIKGLHAFLGSAGCADAFKIQEHVLWGDTGAVRVVFKDGVEIILEDWRPLEMHRGKVDLLEHLGKVSGSTALKVAERALAWEPDPLLWPIGK